MNFPTKTAIYAIRLTETFIVQSSTDVFCLTEVPIESSLTIFRNGEPETGTPAVFAGKNFTLAQAQIGDELQINYAPTGGIEISKEQNRFVFGETPVGAVNGANASFQTQFSFVPETVQIQMNGLTQKLVDDYQTSGVNQILFIQSPEIGDKILINYLRG